MEKGKIAKRPNLSKNLNRTKKSLLKKLPSIIKDKVQAPDGRIFYPCQFCNKVFPIKKDRLKHIQTCSAKLYILSVDESVLKPAQSKEIIVQQDIPIAQEKKAPPIKLTIRRSSPTKEQFTIANPLKEKNEYPQQDDIDYLTKRLESNSVTVIKKTVEGPQDEKTPNDDDDDEKACRECNEEFESPLDLLRHSRKTHSYPKILMAMSEVKKFYNEVDRSECPICRKPLKSLFKSAFIKHLHTHTNEMKYACQVCKKKFRRLDHMKAHEKRHVTETS